MNALNILIFGATSAIAQAVARIYATQGATLYLVARNADKLEILCQDLRVHGAAQVHYKTQDLDHLQTLDSLCDDIFTHLGRCDIALIAQGSLPDQTTCEQSPLTTASSLHNNFIAPACLAQCIAQRLKQQKQGTLAVIGSVAGDRGRQSNYIYGSAKGGLDRFLQGLRNRLTRENAHVLTIKPGFVDTPMTAAFTKGPLWASPERVAQDIVHAIARRKNVLYTPGFWRIIMGIIRHIPEPIFKKLKL